MPARRSHLRPARLVAIFMALLSLAVAILWVDSYRNRIFDQQMHDPPAFVRSYYIYDWAEAEANLDVGVKQQRPLGDRADFSFRTFEGRLRLQLESRVSAVPPVQPVDITWGDFEYARQEFTFVVHTTHGKKPSQFPNFCIRKLAFPFWALFLLCAAYPTIYIIRGPLRRHRRRRRGQCLECGYDLRGSGGQCPECGVAATDSLA